MRTEARRIVAAVLAGGVLILSGVRPVGADLVREIMMTRALAEAMATKLRPAPAVAAASPEPAVQAIPGLRAFGASPRAESVGRRAALHRLIDETALRHGLSPAFVHAVVAAESGYDPRARSSKGAMGLMQLMPRTASLLGVADPWDPAANVDGGVRFLADLIAEFDDAELALVGYNAGPEVVRRGWRVPDETRAYIGNVMTRFRRLRDATTR